MVFGQAHCDNATIGVDIQKHGDGKVSSQVKDENEESRMFVENVLDELLSLIVEDSCATSTANYFPEQNIPNIFSEAKNPQGGMKVIEHNASKKSFVCFNKFSVLENEAAFDDEEEFEESEPQPLKNKIIKSGQSLKLNKKKSKSRKFEKDINIINSQMIRCKGCFQTHFPLPKFCRWWNNKHIKCTLVRQEPIKLKKGEILLIKERIQQ